MSKSDLGKKTLFEDSDDESDGGGAKLKVNSEFAKRFEHNKKREELHRLEEKYKSKNPNAKAGNNADDDDESESSSSDEDEDGFLATEALDAQLNATLQAIRSKDPRVYDGKTAFYDPIEASADLAPEKKDKPVYLQDYHREKILRGDTGADLDTPDPSAPPRTYVQQQNDLQRSIRDEIKAQMQGDDSDDAEEGEDFIKAKPGAVKPSQPAPQPGVHPSRAAKVGTKSEKPDISIADKDPELFLSNFMSSRAWLQEGSKWEAFESDDEDPTNQADEWEAAYNLRFEDPSKSNEVLKSYSRDLTNARSVRREDKSARKRQREEEREKKAAEKQERKEERARLRRLKVDEADSKLQKIKKAAGLSGRTLSDSDWQKFLDGAWDNDKWEEEMQKTFNDEYYAEADPGSDDDDEGKKRKVKKPKWDDDIDIKDLVPDFDDDEAPAVGLSDEDEGEDEDEDEEGPSAKRRKTTKDRKKERLASQKEARKERAKLEALVDARMNLDDPEILASNSQGGQPKFSYRDTRPESFGLTTRDILMADDTALNEFAGLKKLAHWRDADKMARDRKRLGKKARLRQWRRDTFGREFEREPPAYNPGGGPPGDQVSAVDDGINNVVEGGSKKKRKRTGRGKKGQDTAA